jgi:hypothetical protein
LAEKLKIWKAKRRFVKHVFCPMTWSAHSK